MRWILICCLLLGCGRSLTDQEVAFMDVLMGDGLDTDKVRLIDRAPVRAYTLRIPVRPRVTCKERIFPPPRSEVVTGAPAAVALFNRVYFNKDFYLDNYLRGYPDRMNLYAAMLFAHEMTHMWQWQNRKITKYHPLKAASEHQSKADPYLFDPDETRDFLGFGYEQQAAIVEEYLCCATLDPKAPRTARLRAMLSAYFPVDQLPTRDVIVGWKDVQVKGICR